MPLPRIIENGMVVDQELYDPQCRVSKTAPMYAEVARLEEERFQLDNEKEDLEELFKGSRFIDSDLKARVLEEYGFKRRQIEGQIHDIRQHIGDIEEGRYDGA